MQVANPPTFWIGSPYQSSFIYPTVALLGESYLPLEFERPLQRRPAQG
jgi:hypothetical protein